MSAHDAAVQRIDAAAVPPAPITPLRQQQLDYVRSIDADERMRLLREQLLDISHRLLELADTQDVRNLGIVQQLHLFLPQLATHLSGLVATGTPPWTGNGINSLQSDCRSLSQYTLRAVQPLYDRPDSSRATPDIVLETALDNAQLRSYQTLIGHESRFWQHRTVTR